MPAPAGAPNAGRSRTALIAAPASAVSRKAAGLWMVSPSGTASGGGIGSKKTPPVGGEHDKESESFA